MDDETQDLITDVMRKIRMGDPVSTPDLKQFLKAAVPAQDFLRNAGREYRLVTIDLQFKIAMVERWLELRAKEKR